MFLLLDVKTSEQQDALILKAVKEWCKGCTCTTDRPTDCGECTKALTERLEEIVHNIIPNR